MVEAIEGPPTPKPTPSTVSGTTASAASRRRRARLDGRTTSPRDIRDTPPTSRLEAGRRASEYDGAHCGATRYPAPAGRATALLDGRPAAVEPPPDALGPEGGLVDYQIGGGPFQQTRGRLATAERDVDLGHHVVPEL